MRFAINTTRQIFKATFDYQGVIAAARRAGGFAATSADGWISSSPIMLTRGELPPVNVPGTSNSMNTGRSE
jgi:hypothetical protein